MAKIDFDTQFFQAQSRAERDPHAAVEALIILAAYMREGRELTPDIVEYFAGAIEASKGKPPKEFGAALLRNLNLTAGNRRPVNVDERNLGRAFDDLMASGESQNAAATQIAVAFGISESTAVRLWKEHRRIEEEIERIRYDDDNGG
jgi:hypothetical protein